MKCYITNEECEFAYPAHEDDPNDTLVECLAIFIEQCPIGRAT